MPVCVSDIWVHCKDKICFGAPTNTQVYHSVPVVTVAALSLVSTPRCLIFIKSISAASVAVVLRRPRPPSKSILIDHHWLSQMRIDSVQTHAQGPFKTHSLHNSLTNEVLPPLWRFIQEIIFDLFTIVQLQFSLKPIKVESRRDMRCVTL